MNILSMVSHKPFQRIHPLSLLAQLISRQSSGCLQVVSGSNSWLIYLNQGKLTFATSSIEPFERLDRHLQRLSEHTPALISAVRSQARLLHENIADSHPASSGDFQAIRWLVEQQYLDLPQATCVIEEIAKEVIVPLLSVTEGMYELTDAQKLTDYPNLCQLDLRSIVEQSHNQAQRQKITSRSSEPVPEPVRTDVRHEPASPSYQAAPERLEFAPAAQSIAAGFRSTPIEPVAKTRYTVACIDDSPTILQAISTFLDDSNFSVLMINDPVKALMQVVRNKPDVILLDVGMPNLDGYELCSLLRRHPNFKHTPIIMVTGHTGFIDRARAKLVGASGYLTKPFTQSELLKTMFKFLT
jgi:two-component system, chemotaxis family, response regulator PixG